jgi:hypothetical protein
MRGKPSGPCSTVPFTLGQQRHTVCIHARELHSSRDLGTPRRRRAAQGRGRPRCRHASGLASAVLCPLAGTEASQPAPRRPGAEHGGAQGWRPGGPGEPARADRGAHGPGEPARASLCLAGGPVGGASSRDQTVEHASSFVSWHASCVHRLVAWVDRQCLRVQAVGHAGRVSWHTGSPLLGQ